MRPERRSGSRSGRRSAAALLGLAMCLTAGGLALVWNSASAEPGATVVSGALLAQQAALLGSPEAAKVRGPDKCMECHKPAHQAWEKTPHFQTFEAMSESARTKQIAAAMDIKGSLKRNENMCWSCHFTAQPDGQRVKPKWGISCESCHGAADEWFDLHKTLKAADAEARKKIYADCDSRGMIRKDRLYLIAENCFSCHTTPNEELVNKGGHHAGSDFELVAWSQGAVRHNFLENATANRANTPAHLRVMYVVGKLVELEVTLRNLAAAKSDGGEYFKFMLQRANRVLSDLAATQKAVGIAEVGDALAAVPRDEAGALRVAGLADVAPLSEASTKVKAAARKFAESNDGSKLEAIDPLLPKPESYKGTAFQP